MAAWIKVEVTTPDKPEVVQISDILGIDQDTVVGKLIRIWSWADSNSINGNGVSVTKTFINRYVHCSEFAEAMEKVKWLKGVDGALIFPQFDRHNGQTAKSRGLTHRRVTKTREKVKRNCNGSSVTKSLPDKIREEYNTTTEKPSKACSDEAVNFAKWFDQLNAGRPKATESELAKWAKCYDELVRIEKRSPWEIKDVCQWIATDDFWSKNILSPMKLRKKNSDGVKYYDVIRLRMSKTKPQMVDDGGWADLNAQ